MPHADMRPGIIAAECHGAHVSVHEFGATIVSWKVDGSEKLFVSSKAVWDGSKPIRGGIPLVFPQFGTGPICPGQHGFARNQLWKVERASPDVIVCKLSENEQTLRQWPHKFVLTYTIRIEPGGVLRTGLRVENPSDGLASFEFTCLLHTYFDIGSIESVRVTGFSGLEYSNKLLAGAKTKEDRPVVDVSEEVDRTYLNIPDELELSSAMGKVKIQKRNFKDAVLWNPWVEKAKAMTDFGDEEYMRMVCVELGSVAVPRKLAVGQSWEGEQKLSWGSL